MQETSQNSIIGSDNYRLKILKCSTALYMTMTKWRVSLVTGSEGVK